jgi:uncharacterized protein YraI
MGVALAAPAVATTTINVRSGPGPGFGVVDVLNGGDQVDVQQCQGSWCLVSGPGSDGWVSANYLDRTGAGYSSGSYDDSYDNGDDNGYDEPYYVAPRPRAYINVYPPRGPHYYPRHRRGYDGGGNVCSNGPGSYFCFGN